ncbi:MAG: hypothetical protein GWP06_11775 [Actinobacteria bacterium]|nr:hypothetical protein [Actinomycetota bacterium]
MNDSKFYNIKLHFHLGKNYLKEIAGQDLYADLWVIGTDAEGQMGVFQIILP